MLLAVPTRDCGDVGTVAEELGVTLFEATEEELVPILFVAVTVNVYGVPFARPKIVINEEVPVAVIFPGLESTVYEVMVAPPLEEGAVKEIIAKALPAVAVGEVGAPGIVAKAVVVNV